MQDSDRINPLTQSNATAEQRQALAEVANALRALNQAGLFVNAEAAELDGLAKQIRSLTDAAQSLCGERMLEYFRPGFDADSGEGLLPYSPIGGWHNAVTPAIDYRVEGEQVVATVSYGHSHEGPPGSVHGGIVAGVFDQVMAAVCALHRRAGPTAFITVQYLQTTPLFKTLTFIAGIDRSEGKKTFVKAECLCDGEKVTTAEALFIHYLPRQENGNPDPGTDKP